MLGKRLGKESVYPRVLAPMMRRVALYCGHLPAIGRGLAQA